MNGVTNRFPLAQQAYEISDFRVSVEITSGNIVPLVYRTDYVIDPFTQGIRATIVLSSTWEDGNTLVVENDIPYGQTAEIARVGLFDGGLIEDGMDRVGLTILRSLQREVTTRLRDEQVEPEFLVADTTEQKKAQRDRIHARAETRYGEETLGDLNIIAGVITG